MKIVSFGKKEDKIWSDFSKFFDLSQDQVEKFIKYYSLLVEENKNINLTTLTSLPDIVDYHFSDSLMLSKFFDMNNIKSICDVGAGAGFPGIPLKILNPESKLVLIEVVNKKVRFLEKVIEALELGDSIVSNLDWRTFLRYQEHEIDFFCARASLQPEELVRIFNKSNKYADSQLVYWASNDWAPDKKISGLVKRQEAYSVGDRDRKFVFFHN